MALRARAFGMHLVIWSRHLAPGAADLEALSLPAGPHDLRVAVVATPEEVAASCDALSVHLALAPETRGLVNAALLSRLKSGACFINTARAEIVDQDALEQAIRDRGLRVALDVYKDEPSASTGDFTDPIAKQPGVYGTHHIGASTDQAQEAIADETVRIVRTFKQTGKVPNVVNLAMQTPATWRLIVRHRDRPGVLAHVFDQLRAASINVQETENVIFAGAEAAVARINLDNRPTDAVIALIASGHPDVLSAQLVAIQ
jgi:D-3-phosphoglycerate dehydrogenase